jgi:hypothetical protein
MRIPSLRMHVLQGQPEYRLERARLLASRLERLSADSGWARKASGLRGTLLRAIERLEDGEADQSAEVDHLDRLLDQGFEILNRAAGEIPG